MGIGKGQSTPNHDVNVKQIKGAAQKCDRVGWTLSLIKSVVSSQCCHMLYCSGKSQSDLRRHMDTHNENEYICHITECDFTCRTYGSLSKHFKEQHQVTICEIISDNNTSNHVQQQVTARVNSSVTRR